MENLPVFLYQSGISYLVLGCLAAWVVAPYLRTRAPNQALTLLLVPFLFRHVGATTLAVGVVTSEYSRRAAWIVTVGDTASVLLALACVWLLRRRSRLALPALWIFSAENVGYSLYLVATEGLAALIRGIGAHWYIGTFFVPMMMVAQVLIGVRLVRREVEID